MEVLQARSIGVRSDAQEFLMRVYAWMAVGLSITGVVAYLTISTGLFLNILPILTPLMLGSLVFCWALQLGIDRITPGMAAAAFVVYSSLLGLVLSPIFLIYTQASIAKVFFITAGTFGGMSLYGMTTRQDLSSVGSLCIMGFWGIFLAALVNLFIGSEQISWIVSFLGVPIFVGLAAYYNQELVRMAQQLDHNSAEGKKATIIGALRLYITFVNLFLSLLRLFGSRR